MGRKPTLAVWKFSSCDGCQLSLLACEDELLSVADALTIAYFPEATSASAHGPYDVSLVEGSVTTAHDAARIHAVRAQSRLLVAIGACATSGGIQALRNLAEVSDWVRLVYAHPEYIATLGRSTPISAHVKVDLELQGCPIDKGQLLDVIASILHGTPPRTPAHSVCLECKLRGTPCVTVTRGEPCMGPITHAGCGALCPAYARGCFGCYGPCEAPNAPSLTNWWSSELHVPRDTLAIRLRHVQAAAPAFAEESARHA